MTTIDISADWGEALGKVPALADVPEWRLAVVLGAGQDEAAIGLQPARLAIRQAQRASARRGAIPPTR